MIPRIEYRDVYDKSAWGDGPWQHEPDKCQWWDEPAAMACLICRAPVSGSLCGYVGAPPFHPAYGLHYDGVTQAEADAARAAWSENTRAWARAGYPDLMRWMQAHPLPSRPGPMPGIGERLADVRVHGGLTYNGPSCALDEVAWAKFYANFDSLRAQALLYPRGDAAQALAEWGPGEDDYAWWFNRRHASGISAVDDDGKLADLWWFGFDCGHSFDFSPAIHSLLRQLQILPRLPPPPGYEEVYRDWAYVEGEVEALAVQFAEMIVDLARAQPS